MENKMDLLTRAKKLIKTEFNGYNNGHSGYMVVGVGRNTFLEWCAKKVIDDTELEIGGLRFEKQNGINIAYFDTCEKSPALTDSIAEAFPDATCYGYGQWDSPVISTTSETTYETSLEECFEDDGNIRIDVKVTDKESGATFCVGDLICFEDLTDIGRRQHNDNYSYLTGLLSSEEMETVEKVIEECKDVMKYNEYLDDLHDKDDTPVTVEIGGEFKSRLLYALNDLLEYHINDSDCANEYSTTILAHIELLYRMGKVEDAERYKNDYLEHLKDIEDSAEEIKEVNELWESLTA